MKLKFASILTILCVVGCSDASKEQGSVESPIAMEYESLVVTDGSVDEAFKVEPLEFGNAINFISRAGVVNILEGVVSDVEATGYVVIDKAYRFGSKYVLVISTGEYGASCPATSYVLVFDVKSEAVTSKSTIEGCSELVESLSEGNKLTIKKDGSSLTIVNAVI